MVRFIALLCLLPCFAAARADAVDPRDAYLAVEATPAAGKPFEQEMVLLTVHGFFTVPITLEKLAHPDFADFGWMQLGRDSWGEQDIEGRKVRVFERHIALFPKKHGKLAIGSFTHHLTLLDGDGNRFAHDITSAPLAVDVARKPEGYAWWLPARGVAVTDTWDKPPDALAFGDSAVRTITLTVAGVGPEMLPVAPVMKGEGLIAFQGPEDRSVELTPAGPVSTVIWRWTVRMLSPGAKPLETATIAWFDTVARARQEITFAPQRVALAAAITSAPSPGTTPAAFRPGIVIGLLAGLLAGLALLLPGWRLKPWRDIAAPWRSLARRMALRQAARRGDAKAMWRLARKIDHPCTDELAARLFGKSPVGPVDLRKLARSRFSTAILPGEGGEDASGLRFHRPS